MTVRHIGGTSFLKPIGHHQVDGDYRESDTAEVYDFPSDAEGKAIPYEVYDITKNKGWVSVGIDHDTAEFATNTIKTWWTKMGQLNYPNAQKLLIIADGGGSNSSRSRLWNSHYN